SFTEVWKADGFRIFAAHTSRKAESWLPYLGKNDYVIFSDPFYSEVKSGAYRQYERAKHPENLFFLSNDSDMHYARLVNGFPNCKLINQNAFIVPDYFFPIDGAEKKYDAIYNARPRKFKRHYLARKVGEAYRLALILGKHVASLDDVNESELPKHIYKNKIGRAHV